jgi:hypothetical protein
MLWRDKQRENVFATAVSVRAGDKLAAGARLCEPQHCAPQKARRISPKGVFAGEAAAGHRRNAINF